MSVSRPKLIVVAGALANKPHNGGEAWVRLSWLLGFRELGFRIFLLEQIDQHACVDTRSAPARFAASSNLRYFDQVVAQFGLQNDAALLCETAGEVHGAAPSDS